jgi:hypothetical protein
MHVPLYSHLRNSILSVLRQHMDASHEHLPLYLRKGEEHRKWVLGKYHAPDPCKPPAEFPAFGESRLSPK